jgi:hypothetical protein
MKMWIGRESMMMTVNGANTVFVRNENSHQTATDFGCDLFDGREVARGRRILGFEFVSVIVMKRLKGLDGQEVDREPDRSTDSSNVRQKGRPCVHGGSSRPRRLCPSTAIDAFFYRGNKCGMYQRA